MQILPPAPEENSPEENYNSFLKFICPLIQINTRTNFSEIIVWSLVTFMLLEMAGVIHLKTLYFLEANQAFLTWQV